MKKIVKRVFIGIGILVLAVLVFIALYVLIGKTIHRNEIKIKSTTGIQESVTIEINDIQQELSIYGEDQSNPVVLLMHGGPGSPIGYMNYIWQPKLSNEFTFVTYDQRGCGRTYYANPNAEVSRELILQDMDKTVDYLRERFNQDKVVIMGHSWGTLLGTLYVYEHPEKVSAYIGIGQVVDTYNGEGIAFEEAIRRAEAANDTEYIEEMTNAYNAFLISRKVDADFRKFRNMEPKYLLGDREKTMKQLLPEGLTSPNISIEDLKWFLFDNSKVSGAGDNPLTKGLFQFDAYSMLQYQVPMYFVSGGNDYITPFSAVEAYYKSISAPEKDMVIIDGVGHSPFLDVPDEFADIFKRLVLKE